MSPQKSVDYKKIVINYYLVENKHKMKYVKFLNVLAEV